MEFEPEIYDVLTDNMNKLQAANYVDLELIRGDASFVKKELDKYDWFYFFSPFYDEVLAKVVQNIVESIHRNNRKIHIIRVFPAQSNFFAELLKTQVTIKLVNQFTVPMRRRVVSIWENFI